MARWIRRGRHSPRCAFVIFVAAPKVTQMQCIRGPNHWGENHAFEWTESAPNEWPAWAIGATA